jgi:hypothetical protein
VFRFYCRYYYGAGPINLLNYLFIVYLMFLSVVQIIKCQLVGQSASNGLERIGKEAVVA